MWNTGMLVADSLVIRNSYLLFLGGQQIKFQGPSFQYIEGDSNSLWAKSIDCKKWEEYFCIFLNFYRSLLRSLWPPWSKTNNNQPVETLEVKWQQILLLWRLPTCSFKTLLRKLHNQISLKELFKHKVNGLTRSAKSQQLCFHCTAELSSCIGPFLNLWLLLQLCPGSAGRTMCAFALLESSLLLGLIYFWTDGIYSAPCSCHQKLLFCKMLGGFGCLIFPQEQLLRNAKDMMSGSAEGWIMNCFPKLNKSGSTASLSQVPGWLDLSKFIP